MTEPGRASKEARRRSSKQSTSSVNSQKRPKSDPHRSTASNPQSPQSTVQPASRPKLQDRTYSEPRRSKNKSISSKLTVSSAQSETFLFRPSIDQSNAQHCPTEDADDTEPEFDTTELQEQKQGLRDTSPVSSGTTTEVEEDSATEEDIGALYPGPKTASLRGEDVVLAVSQQTLSFRTVANATSEDALLQELVPDAVNDQASRRRGSQLQVRSSLITPRRSAERSSNSFLNLEDSPRRSFGQRLEDSEESDSDELTRQSSNDDSTIHTSASSVWTFDDLTEKLLAPGSIDHKFVLSFLNFYRFFAAPSRLLDAIIRHFDAHNLNDITPWIHEPTLDKDLTIIEQWINTFPGDFAKQSTRSKLRRFLARVVAEHGIVEEEQLGGFDDTADLTELLGNAARLAASASQIRLTLDYVQEDDDTDWACADEGSLKHSRTNTFLSISSTDSQADGEGSAPLEPLSRVTSTNPAYDVKLIFGGQSTLTLNAMGSSRSAANQDSGNSSQTLLDIAESAGRQAALLSPTSTYIFNKLPWRGFISHPDDMIARELTRIDWIMFSSIRPRDLIRHVTVPAADRGRYRSLENVTRMIEHFNHIAYWVTNVILYRDKPKHRAEALEKFMRIARKLRELNNYNALGAVIAGIQGTSVYRLGATKELVSQAVQRDFMKLEILMATTKGHWAYRLAWENTTTERIPFLPLHRRDLVVANAAGKTFIPTPQSEQPPDLESLHVSKSNKSIKSSKSSTRKGTPNSTGRSAATQSPTKSSLPPSQSSSAQINWPKFSVMGDILSTIQRAQVTPYNGFTENEEIKNLVLDHELVKDDDKLYERSVALEPGAAGAALAAASGTGATSPVGVVAAFQNPNTRKRVLEKIGQLVG